MNKIKLFFSSLVLLAIAVSCNPEPDLPVVLFEDAEKGAFARQLDFGGAFFLTDVPGSSVNWEVEFYDEDQGSHVTEYAWTVAYTDVNGGVNVGETPLATFPSGNFGTSASGLPSTSATWTLQQVFDVLGLDANSVSGGSYFDFYATVKRDDGKEFTVANTDPSIIANSPFAALFSFRMPLLCTSDLAGTYLATSSGTSTDGCCPGPYNSSVTVTLEMTGDGEYSITDWSGGLYYDWYGPDGGNYGITLDNVGGTLLDACENISFGHLTEPFGETVEATGTVDAATKIIEYSWTNGWGDAGTVKLTPQ